MHAKRADSYAVSCSGNWRSELAMLRGPNYSHVPISTYASERDCRGMLSYLKKLLGLDSRIITLILPSETKLEQFRAARKEQLKAYKKMALAASDEELLEWVLEREEALERLDAMVRSYQVGRRE